MIYVLLLTFPLIFAANEESNNVPKSASFTWGPSNTYTNEQLDKNFEYTKIKLHELENGLANLKNHVTGYATIDYLHAHAQEYRTKINEINNKFQQINNEIDKKVTQKINSEINPLKKQVNENKIKGEQNTEKILKFEPQITEIKVEGKENSGKIMRIEPQVKDHNSTIQNNTRDIELLRGSLAEQILRIDQGEIGLQDLRKILETWDPESEESIISNHSRQISIITTRMEDLNNRVYVLDEKFETQQQNITNHTAEIKTLKIVFEKVNPDNVESEVAKNTRNIEIMKTKIMDNSMQLETLENTTKILETLENTTKIHDKNLITINKHLWNSPTPPESIQNPSMGLSERVESLKSDLLENKIVLSQQGKAIEEINKFVFKDENKSTPKSASFTIISRPNNDTKIIKDPQRDEKISQLNKDLELLQMHNSMVFALIAGAPCEWANREKITNGEINSVLLYVCKHMNGYSFLEQLTSLNSTSRLMEKRTELLVEMWNDWKQAQIYENDNE